MFGVLVKRAWVVEDLLVLFIIVTLGVRLTNGGDDVFWSVVVILARPVSSCSITATIAMVAAVVGAAVVTPQCYGCTKTLASHEHVHYHLIHKHHTMMNVSFHVCFI